MRIRMIFGTTVEIDGKPVELKCDTTQDVPDAVALPLIERGRAESTEPAEPTEPAKKGKK